MPTTPHLISHHLCPYVQRAVIVAAEKGIAIERTSIDLAAKPDWFLAVSPTGKVPLLRIVDEAGVEHVVFESAAICEYLDETSPSPMLPAGPLARAKARAWVEYASGTLSDIAGFYGAREKMSFDAKYDALRRRFARLEDAIVGPWFEGGRFGLVDAAFGPVFRYLDVFETRAGVDLVSGLATVPAWRKALAVRPSVAEAVAPDYSDRLVAFLRSRESCLSAIIA